MTERRQLLVISVVVTLTAAFAVCVVSLLLFFRSTVETQYDILVAATTNHMVQLLDQTFKTENSNESYYELKRYIEDHQDHFLINQSQTLGLHILVIHDRDDDIEKPILVLGNLNLPDNQIPKWLISPANAAVKGKAIQSQVTDEFGRSYITYSLRPKGVSWSLLGVLDASMARNRFWSSAVRTSVFSILIVMVGSWIFLFFGGRILDRLDESESQTRSALKNLKDLQSAIDQHSIVSVMNINGEVTSVNDNYCKYSGYSRSELIGQDFRRIKGSFFSNIVSDKLWKSIQKGQVWKGVIYEYSRNRKRYWLDTTVVPILDNDNAVKSFISIQTDVTEKKLVERELQKQKESADLANKAKSHFLAHISHEIRTPLSAIIGFSDLLGSSDSGQEDRIHYIDSIKRNSQHLSALIDDVLDLSKIEAAELEVENRTVNLRSELRTVLSLMTMKANEKKIDLQVSIDLSVPQRIHTDPTRLRQILINVMGNAIKFTERGMVSIKATLRHNKSQNKNLLVFTVRDTGRGIAPQKRQKIFEPFVQADTTTTRKFGGTGLGLTLSRRLARALGGDVVVLESQLGKGSTFEITIDPQLKTPGIAKKQEPSSSIPVNTLIDSPNRLKGIQVLLVEDSLDIQYLFKRILETNGASVEIVAQGDQGVERALEGDFDIVLMDIHIPVIDGFKATLQLRENGYSKPIIALTAHATKTESDRALQSGCNDFCSKPISAPELIETVSRWARQKMDRQLPSSESLSQKDGITPMEKLSKNGEQLGKPPVQDETDANENGILVSTLAEDPILKDTVKAFVTRLPDRFQKFHSLYKDEDWEGLSRMAHQLKGTFSSYGYPPLTKISAQIEIHAKGDNNKEELDKLFNDLGKLVSRVQA